MNELSTVPNKNEAWFALDIFDIHDVPQFVSPK
jgi:hypothetical protein